MKRDFKSKNKIYIILLIFVCCISIGYAVMNRELTIIGNSEVKSNSWDIHFENVKVKSGSVETTTPTINNDKDSVNFSFNLNLPGDYYSFTVDVVNSGTIDGMIESISKNPELTEAQKKYLNYIIEYENGEEITSKQLVKKESFVRVKVRVEYRSDITEADLPGTNDTLNLGLTLNYVQADGTGSNVKDNGVYNPVRVVSGDINTVGSEIAIGDEHFYVISSDETNVNMLSKYNLLVGNSVIIDDDYNVIVTPLANPTGIQDSNAIGWFEGGGTTDKPYIGAIAFSSTNYWKGTVSEYPAYVYDSNSTLYTHVENYKNYLTSLGATISDARLIKVEELETLGCLMRNYNCSEAPEWVYSTTYWSGSANDTDSVWRVYSNGSFGNYIYRGDSLHGLRPVIVISKSLF